MRSWSAPCTPVHTSDARSIAIPRVYRDASAELAAAAVSVGLAWLGRVMVIGGSARGRESVAMITPDETTATAIFKKKREAKGGGRVNH